jgi:hypothetical protein
VLLTQLRLALVVLAVATTKQVLLVLRQVLLAQV